MQEYSSIKWAKFVLNFVKYSFTGTVAFSIENDVVIVKPFDVFLFLVGITCSTIALIYSCSRLDINNPSIIRVGNQLTASAVILIAIFTIIINFVFHNALFNSFKLLDSSDQLVSCLECDTKNNNPI